MGYSPKASLWRLYKKYIWDCRRGNHFFELTFEQFTALVSKNCSYCGRPPEQKSRSFVYTGIDRINPKRGYEMTNVVPACKECNGIKSNRLTHEEMKIVGEALRRFRQRRS